MIGSILPPAAAWAELFRDPEGVALYAEEEAAVGQAIDSRRREFATGHVESLKRSRPEGPAWDRLFFCAKEAVFKAWYPLTERWLGFDHARVTIDPVAETFSADLLEPGPAIDGHDLRNVFGRWRASDGLIAAAVGVPARHR